MRVLLTFIILSFLLILTLLFVNDSVNKIKTEEHRKRLEIEICEMEFREN